MKEEYLWIIKEVKCFLNKKKKSKSSMARKKLVKNERKQKFECFFYFFYFYDGIFIYNSIGGSFDQQKKSLISNKPKREELKK